MRAIIFSAFCVVVSQQVLGHQVQVAGPGFYGPQEPSSLGFNPPQGIPIRPNYAGGPKIWALQPPQNAELNLNLKEYQSPYPSKLLILPNKYAPNNDLPSGFLPNKDFPRGFFPNKDLPSGFFPNKDFPRGFFPNKHLPSGFLPGTYFPNNSPSNTFSVSQDRTAQVFGSNTNTAIEQNAWRSDFRPHVSDLSGSSYIVASLAQKLRNPTQKIAYSSKLQTFKYEYWNYLLEEFVQIYNVQQPSLVAVYKGSDTMAKVKNLNTVLSSFIQYLRKRWASLMVTNNAVKKIFDDLIKYKEDLSKKGPNSLDIVSIFQPNIDYTSNVGGSITNTGNLHLNNASIGNVNTNEQENRLGGNYRGDSNMQMSVGKNIMLEWIKQNKEYNLPQTSAFDVDINAQVPERPSGIVFQPSCDLGSIRESIAILLNKPNIDLEITNLKILFKIIKEYIIRSGIDDLPFSEIVINIGKALLSPKDKREGPNEVEYQYQLGWQMFLNSFNSGEIRGLIDGAYSGRYSTVLHVKIKLKEVFTTLKILLTRQRLSNQVVLAVLNQGLRYTLRSLMSFFGERCKKTTYNEVLESVSRDLEIKQTWISEDSFHFQSFQK